MEREENLELLLTRYADLVPLRAELYRALEVLQSAFSAGGKLLVGGNGGSAADSEHMVGELMKSFAFRRSIPAAVQETLSAQGERGAGRLPWSLCVRCQPHAPSDSFAPRARLSGVLPTPRALRPPASPLTPQTSKSSWFTGLATTTGPGPKVKPKMVSHWSPPPCAKSKKKLDRSSSWARP